MGAPEPDDASVSDRPRWWTTTIRDWWAERKTPVPIPHGTMNGYTNRRCHCVRCKAANAEWQRERRRSRNSANAPHGTANGYTNYRCRCTPCTTAATNSRRR